MYKVKHSLVPDCVSELFVRKGSAHSLRNSDSVLPRFETIRYGKYSVRYLEPFVWSKNTENQRDSPSPCVFINKIRKVNLDEIVINKSNCCNLCSQYQNVSFLNLVHKFSYNFNHFPVNIAIFSCLLLVSKISLLRLKTSTLK